MYPNWYGSAGQAAPGWGDLQRAPVPGPALAPPYGSISFLFSI